MRVLVIEDEELVQELLELELTERGHDAVIVGSGTKGVRVAKNEVFDVIILDIMLPGMDGFKVAASLRTLGCATPILMLTALAAEADVVRGLEAGADDYLSKPFGRDELHARLASLTRRPELGRRSLQFADLHLDRVSRSVRRGTATIKLTNVEFRLLETLMLRVGEVVPQRDLLARVWGIEFDPKTTLLRTHLHNLRVKLEVGGRSRLIQVVAGIGYELNDA